MICRILYPFFKDIIYFGSSSSNILDFFFSSIYLIFPSKKYLIQVAYGYISFLHILSS